MSRNCASKKIIDYLVLIIALLIFISGFYILAYICLNGNNSGRPVILDKDLFTDSNLKQRVQDFQISNVEQIRIPDVYYNKYDYIDNNTIEALVYDAKKRMAVPVIFNKLTQKVTFLKKGINYSFPEQPGILYPEQKLLSGLYRKSGFNYFEFHQDISPDRKKILETFSNMDYTLSTSVYDISNQTVTDSYPAAFPVCWLPDSSGYVGLDEYMFIQDITTGEKKNIIKADKLTAIPIINKSEKSGSVLDNLVRDIDLKVSKDGKYAYVFSRNNENSSTDLLIVNMHNGALEKSEVKCSIKNIEPINSETILIQGEVNGEPGVFLYKFHSDDLINIIGNKVLSINVSPDGEKIAYTIQNKNDGNTDIHVAYIDSNSMSNDEVFYSDMSYISTLRWTRDSRRISCMINGTIYEFSFRNM